MTSYLPYGWSILSTSHSISEHYQSSTSDTETEMLSILQCLHFSNIRTEKYIFFLFFRINCRKTSTPLIYTGISKLFIETGNSGTQLKNRQEKCFSSSWLPKRKYFFNPNKHTTYNLGPAKGIKPGTWVHRQATGPSYQQTSFSQISGLLHTQST